MYTWPIPVFWFAVNDVYILPLLWLEYFCWSPYHNKKWVYYTFRSLYLTGCAPKCRNTKCRNSKCRTHNVETPKCRNPKMSKPKMSKVQNVETSKCRKYKRSKYIWSIPTKSKNVENYLSHIYESKMTIKTNLLLFQYTLFYYSIYQIYGSLDHLSSWKTRFWYVVLL